MHVTPFRAAALTAALALLLSPSVATASADAKSLDRIVVTGSRTAQSLDDSLASITVLDRADIERLQAGSLLELLRSVPGVSIANNGGAGKVSAVFLRGAEARHTLVLVDGVRMGSATTGTAAFQDLPIEQIERIEVARGPFSSLYGSDAIGGVVQIFTRQPESGTRANASAAIGSLGTRRAGAGVAGRGTSVWYSLQAAVDRTDGIDACRGRPFPNGAGCFTDEPDRDGYLNRSLQLGGGLELAPGLTWEARGMRAEFDTEFDGGFVNESSGAQQVLGSRFDWQASDRLQLSARVGHSADLADNFKDGSFSSRFDTRRRLAGAQADVGIGEGLLSLGWDWHRDAVGSSTAYVIDSRYQRAGFAQWQQSLGRSALQAAVRRDEDSQFGGKTTGNLLWGLGLGQGQGLRLHASAGTAYRAPSFNDLYFPGFGNPELGPETSRSFELGLRGRQAGLGWSVAAFHSEIDALIGFDPQLFIPVNIERALVDGVEASLDSRLMGFDVRLAGTWLDGRNAGNGANRGNALPRRAPRSAQLELDRSFGDFGVGASLYAASSRFDDLGNRARLSGYATLDLRAHWQLRPGLQLQLQGANLLDRQYETAAFFNQPGRTWLLGLRYSP
ncbi:MAG: TonB-dependent vitamin B12 receptor [Aquimonas sp.]|nr:TonB-dependent vitamin B12 receptor [Aquimonas sp.]